ncbi:MAG: CDP-alcohol phosphatidyltransferase family protein [Deltaproteobacteria bacterium]|nr:CDP-alcohol phosphatidyltransferase family protein [Deltaproteobacteria bacterium]
MTAGGAPAVAIVGGRDVRLWGIDGAERLARQLRAAGVTQVARDTSPPASAASVLWLRGDYLFEDRTLADLLRQPGVALTASGARARAVAAHVSAPEAAAARAVVEGEADPTSLSNVVVHSPEAFSTAFVRKLHKAAPPVVLRVRPERAAALERHLFDGSYKGVTDLVTKWLWPAPARAVVRVCARHGIPPNAVTSVSFLLVVGATVLFASGWFGVGLALAWIMTFLDTVDGKLARVTVTSTPFGHYFDHTIDSVHPPVWYIAWALGVTGPTHVLTVLPLLVVIVAFYVGGRFFESFFKHAVGGGSLFAWRPFDSYFRLVMARRNPNLIVLTVSWLAGAPRTGLIVVALWTVLSTVILGVRCLQGMRVRRRSGSLRPWIEELGNEAAVVPGWAKPFVADLAAVRHLVQ